MDQDLAVLSPEKTILTYRVAGLGSRILAHLLDLVVLAAIEIGIYFLTMAIFMVVGAEAATTIALISLSVGPFLYFILQEGLWNGRTVGKTALGLRVRMLDGTAVTFVAALGRNLLRPADMLPPPTFFVGLLSIFTTSRSQRIGDLVCGTVVVHERRPMPYFAPAPHVAGYHPLEGQVGALRGMTPDEYTALRKFCDRFPELHPGVQDKLVREVFLPIASKRAIPLPPNIHPIYLAEAAVMKYGREHGML